MKYKMAKKAQPQKRNETTIKKGEVRNPNGRPKGSVNKINAQQKESLLMVMGKLEETIVEDLGKVSPSRRLQVYIDLMNYIAPKLSATSTDAKVSGDISVSVKFDMGGDNENETIDITHEVKELNEGFINEIKEEDFNKGVLIKRDLTEYDDDDLDYSLGGGVL